MKQNHGNFRMILLFLCMALFATMDALAQTDMDAIMMEKSQFCVGPMAGYSSWKNYWEGTNKRDNANLGTVSTQTYSVMGNYGVNGKLNLLFNLPYIKTKASAGQLHGMKGLQDLSLWVKWLALEREVGSGTLSLYPVGGISFPVSNYSPDYLPLSIGSHSTNLSGRLIADYQVSSWFATISATYVHRSNIELDRSAYFTTEMHYSSKVDLPDAMQYAFRTGIRNERLIAEAILGNWTSNEGFDITKNNMPFPSNKMNMTTAGVNFKYNIYKIAGLSITGGANKTIAGRNVGEASMANLGIFYIISLKQKSKPVDQKKQVNPAP